MVVWSTKRGIFQLTTYVIQCAALHTLIGGRLDSGNVGGCETVGHLAHTFTRFIAIALAISIPFWNVTNRYVSKLVPQASTRSILAYFFEEFLKVISKMSIALSSLVELVTSVHSARLHAQCVPQAIYF